MMKHEFEEIAGYKVSAEDYNNIIEPMYYAANLSKHEFVKTLNKKRFELVEELKTKAVQERRADLQNKAIEYSNECSAFPWSYGELATIGEFFERNGRRYGLIKEFRENGII